MILLPLHFVQSFSPFDLLPVTPPWSRDLSHRQVSDESDDGEARSRRRPKAKAKRKPKKKTKGKGISKRIIADRQLNDTTKSKRKEEKARRKRNAARKAAGGDKASAYHEEIVTLNGERAVTRDDCVEVPRFIADKLKKHQVEGLRFIWQNWFESVDQVRVRKRKRVRKRMLCCVVLCAQ